MLNIANNVHLLLTFIQKIKSQNFVYYKINFTEFVVCLEISSLLLQQILFIL